MPLKTTKILRPDSKGRVTLGNLANGISSFIVTQDKHNRIILDPRVEIPAKEKWLFDNKSALAKVKRGLDNAAEGRVKSRGSFSKYTDDEVKK